VRHNDFERNTENVFTFSHHDWLEIQRRRIRPCDAHLRQIFLHDYVEPHFCHYLRTSTFRFPAVDAVV